MTRARWIGLRSIHYLYERQIGPHIHTLTRKLLPYSGRVRFKRPWAHRLQCRQCGF